MFLGLRAKRKDREAIRAFIRGVSYLAPHGEFLYFHVPGTEHGFIRAQKVSRFIRMHIRHWEDDWRDEVVYLDSDLNEVAKGTFSPTAKKHAMALVRALTAGGQFLLRDEPIGLADEGLTNPEPAEAVIL